jgi:pyridoxamine 5'-phosphate oxidase family protein
MSFFTKEERQYLSSGVRLGRLATVGSDGTPHVVPTSFRYNPVHDTIDIGGHDFAKQKKYRDVLKNPKVAFVVDDIASVNPWRARGIEIRGEAEVLDTGGTELMQGFASEMFRITPKRIVSWGLEEQMSYKGRSVR